MSDRRHRGRDEETTDGARSSWEMAPGKRTAAESIVMRKARDADGVRGDAPDALERAASSSGQPLPGDVRGRFETSLGADLSDVRVHTGSASADAADAVGAKAYTVGRDIHFGQGAYAPGDAFGVHLLAHEVAHTQQQAAGPSLHRKPVDVTTPADAVEREADALADAMVRGAPAPAPGATSAALAREPDPALAELGIGKDDPNADAPATGNGTYGPKYGKNAQGAENTAQANEGKTLKAPDGHGGTYDAPQAQMRPASQSDRKGKGTPMDPDYKITDTDLVYIMHHPGAPMDGKLVATESASASSVNEAFKLMGIDTLEAQAAYLAHASVESKGFEQMSAEADPKSVGEFKGRGPLQVTFQENYVKALAYLDTQIETYDKAGKKDEADRLREVSRAVKADPAAAADPKYAFIFSAAHMHASGGVEKVESLKGREPRFNGNGDEDSWEAGNDDFAAKIAAAKASGDTAQETKYQHYQDAGQRKKAAYDRAIEKLSPHVAKQAPAAP